MRNLLITGLFVALLATPSQNAFAASDIGLKAIGVDLGYVSPENVDGTLGFGAFAELGSISPKVRLSEHVGYWSKSESSFGTEASIHDVSFTTRARYFFESKSKFQPYAGGGLGLHLLTAEVSSPAMDLGGGFIVPAMSASDSETKLGIDIGGGCVTPVGAKTDLYGDVWYGIVSDFSQFSLKVGLAYKLD